MLEEGGGLRQHTSIINFRGPGKPTLEHGEFQGNKEVDLS